jgi:hypothetical protein
MVGKNLKFFFLIGNKIQPMAPGSKITCLQGIAEIRKRRKKFQM